MSDELRDPQVVPYAEQLAQTVNFSDGIRSRKTDSNYVLEYLKSDNTWAPFLSQSTGALVVTANFTDAQLKTLDQAPLPLIPAPGSGKILVPDIVIATALLKTPYTTWPDSILFKYSGGATFLSINAWDTSTTPVQINSGFSQSGILDVFTNRAIEMSGDGEAPTGGDPANIVRVTMAYFVS